MIVLGADMHKSSHTIAGIAATRVRLMGTTIPDSVVVTATMRHANGTLVPNTVTFVVEFR